MARRRLVPVLDDTLRRHDIKPQFEKCLDFLATFRAFARNHGQSVTHVGWPDVVHTSAWTLTQKCLSVLERRCVGGGLYIAAQFFGRDEGDDVRMRDVADRATGVSPSGWRRWVVFDAAGRPEAVGPDRWADEVVADFASGLRKVSVLMDVRPTLSFLEALQAIEENLPLSFLASIPAYVNNVSASPRGTHQTAVVDEALVLMEDHEYRKRAVWARARVGM